MIVLENTVQKQSFPEAPVKSKRTFLHYLYPSLDFGGGIWKAYFNTYVQMLYTDIYLMPVALGGALELAQSFTGWFAGPLWGTVVDRVTLKKGKYWPWILIGATVCTVVYVLMFTLPYLMENPASLAPLVFVLAMVNAFSTAVNENTITSMYPRLGDTSADRSFLAVGKALGRTSSKAIFGLITPLMIAAFANMQGGNESFGWAATAVIFGPAGLLFYIVFAMLLKRSYIEKEAIAEKAASRSAGKKAPSMAVVFKGIVSNRALLAMFLFFFLHKLYDLSFMTNTASYYWRYYQGNMSAMGNFMNWRTWSQAGGAVLGVYWLKIWKDSKRAFVIAGCLQIVILGIATFVARDMAPWPFTLIMCANQICTGLMEAYTLPLFAGASDWGTWKTGARADGLNMSAYNLALRVCITVGTVIRTAILTGVGYDAAAYQAGGAVPETVKNALFNFQVFFPFLISILAVGSVAFLYPLNDKKLAEIKLELNERKKAEEAAKAAGAAE